MKHGIAISPVAPMRAAADERSEMVSQLLWGETFCVEEQAGRWLRICADTDRYSGWVNPLMVFLPDEAAWRQEAALPSRLCTSALCCAVSEKTGQRVYLPQGSVLYRYSEAARTFTLAGSAYRLEHTLRRQPSHRREASIAAALQLLNAPYLWGGRTLLGIDCSGLTQLAYRVAGVNIPRDAAQQAGMGKPVASVQEAQPADLAFFCSSEEKIIHVGMVLGGGRIIHASGCVRIDSIDSEGIFRSDLNRYTHRLKAVKRLHL
ncbi:MAG: C40 family peptidase [Prevotellaceae bacterium]|jgi:cell wall-associated NlpC family hydrolase|nr:C40 family peptidase [Prevotellaceae bacterium]